MIDHIDVLNRAAELTAGDRLEDYGPPVKMHRDIAAMWSVILGDKLQTGASVGASEVALMMAALKLCRAKASPQSRDSYDDAAAYVAIAAECAEIEERPTRSEILDKISDMVDE